ncbi:MAG: ABC transporter ATP-binding protein [Alphaproteobacteria bacterium]|nr:ABC transporter ATP-binding protein [Alphaproteobacteria bacterium]MCB9930286.1 ABC transporter ATP-binding protein [Alphaproteobacteria bacterium]
MSEPTAPLISVRNLTVAFGTREGVVTAVRDVSFTLGRGETLGIVGESGSGKSVTSYALMGILDANGRVTEGEMRYSGIDLRRADQRQMRDIRGREISMIFQNPRSALNPIRKVGQQIEDVLREHSVAVGAEAKRQTIDLLDRVRIRDPKGRYHAYPHELSGGMCQRVVIALALACRPKVLIADEPTTGLDVTTQKAIMDLVQELARERGLSTILITHDLGLAASYCERLVVMQRGAVVESAAVEPLFAAPSHPYTRALIEATPRRTGTVRALLPPDDPRRTEPDPKPSAGSSAEPLLAVRGLIKEFGGGGPGLGWLPWRRDDKAEPAFRAVDDLSFDLHAGESLGLVGESGCGKSTTSMMIMRLLDPTAGSIRLAGEEIGAVPAARFARHPARAKLQFVFQDPTDSLNPRFTAARCIADPLLRLGHLAGGKAVAARVEALADRVNLPRELLTRFPHQLSGGQKARVGIARAIALDPSVLILDEPTAALDVSVQAVVLNLLADLRAQLGMSYLFVSHDLNVVRLLCERVMVMRAGRIVEQGPTEQVMTSPATDYTRQLLASSPEPPLPPAALEAAE